MKGLSVARAYVTGGRTEGIKVGRVVQKITVFSKALQTRVHAVGTLEGKFVT